MTNQIDKNLAKFSKKELEVVDFLFDKLYSDDLKGINVVQLKGQSDLFRIRKGRIRIIYSAKNNKINILSISRRNEKTYKDF